MTETMPPQPYGRGGCGHTIEPWLESRSVVVRRFTTPRSPEQSGGRFNFILGVPDQWIF